MIQLVKIIDEHPVAIGYDLMAWSGARLRDFPSPSVTWLDLAILVRVESQRSESALFRALRPDMPDRFTREIAALDLDRHILHRLEALVWLKGEGKGSRPDLVKFSWDKPDNPGDREVDLLDLDDAAELLGGDPRMVEAFKRAHLAAIA